MNKKLYISLFLCLPVCLAASDKNKNEKEITPSTITSSASAFSLGSPRSDSDLSQSGRLTPLLVAVFMEQKAADFARMQEAAAAKAKETAQVARAEAKKRAADEEEIAKLQRAVVGCSIS